MSKAVIVIPARYGSSRLPGKPLLDIVGKPMIQHVYERALQVAGVRKFGWQQTISVLKRPCRHLAGKHHDAQRS